MRLNNFVCMIFLVFVELTSCMVFAGQLAEKARIFDENIRKFHSPNGLVFDIIVDDNGNFSKIAADGDSCIWSGAYLAAQAFRYRVTGEKEALENIERTLHAFHILQKITGTPGFLGRSFGKPEWFSNLENKVKGVPPYDEFVYNACTSRDQYTGLFLGYTIAWPLIQDEQLRKIVKNDILQIGRNLQTNNLSMVATINGKQKAFFNVNPEYCYQDRITQDEWEKVDDFPVNIIARNVPYNATTAAALSTFSPPPIRGGEALRALLMIGTCASITQDPELISFFYEELCKNRAFPKIASETCQLMEELYYGQLSEVHERILGGLIVAFAEVAGRYFAYHALLPRGFITLIAPPVRFFSYEFGRVLAKFLAKLIAFFKNPENFKIFYPIGVNLKQLSTFLERIGGKKYAILLSEWGDWFEQISRSSLDELSDTIRSYVGVNLTFFALLGIMEGNLSSELKNVAMDILRRAFRPISDEKNSLYTFIRFAYGGDYIDSKLIEAAKEALIDYPIDQRGRSFDHSNMPGIRILPWPDRFGRYGKLADKIFPISLRAPHIFIWQESPRKIRTSGSSNVRIAPVGYLLAYWLGRFHGFISPDE